MTTQLVHWWDDMRGGANLLAEDMLNPEALENIWDSCCYLQRRDFCSKDNYNYTYLGPSIQRDYDAIGDMVKAVPLISPQANSAHELFDLVDKTQTPIFRAGRMNLPNKQALLYRQTILPIGKDGKLEGFFAGIRLKIKEDLY